MNQSFILLSEQHYQDLTEKLETILSHLENQSEGTNPEILGNKWIPEKEAQRLTGKKATTLWKMRTSGELTFTKLNNRVYYDLESILALLEKNKREAFQ